MSTRPYRYLDGCPYWLWRLLPYSFRWKVVMARDAYDNSPAVLQPQWEKFVEEYAPEYRGTTVPDGFGTLGADWTKNLPPADYSNHRQGSRHV
jgi:hypothetical protein